MGAKSYKVQNKLVQWPPIKKQIHFKIASLVKLTQLGSAPHYLNILLSSHQPARSLRSGDPHLLTVPRTRTVIGSGSVVWNSLPADLRSTDLSLFLQISSKNSFIYQWCRCCPLASASGASDWLCPVTIVRLTNGLLHYITLHYITLHYILY